MHGLHDPLVCPSHSHLMPSEQLHVDLSVLEPTEHGSHRSAPSKLTELSGQFLQSSSLQNVPAGHRQCSELTSDVLPAGQISHSPVWALLYIPGRQGWQKPPDSPSQIHSMPVGQLQEDPLSLAGDSDGHSAYLEKPG